MPSATKFQDLFQSGDLSQSDQQQLAKSIITLKKKRAQKRTVRAASLPFEIHVHSWFYFGAAGPEQQYSKEEVEKMYHVPSTVPHQFIQKPKLTRFTVVEQTPTHYYYYKYRIDAVIRCPDFASTQNVYALFNNAYDRTRNTRAFAYYPGVPIERSLVAPTQILLNFPDKKEHWSETARQQLGIDGNKPNEVSRIWKHFNPDETSRIWVTYKGEIIFDNNHDNQRDLMVGFLNIVGRFMETPAVGFRVDAQGQFIA